MFQWMPSSLVVCRRPDDVLTATTNSDATITNASDEPSAEVADDGFDIASFSSDDLSSP